MDKLTPESGATAFEIVVVVCLAILLIAVFTTAL